MCTSPETPHENIFAVTHTIVVYHRAEGAGLLGIGASHNNSNQSTLVGT